VLDSALWRSDEAAFTAISRSALNTVIAAGGFVAINRPASPINKPL